MSFNIRGSLAGTSDEVFYTVELIDGDNITDGSGNVIDPGKVDEGGPTDPVADPTTFTSTALTPNGDYTPVTNYRVSVYGPRQDGRREIRYRVDTHVPTGTVGIIDIDDLPPPIQVGPPGPDFGHNIIDHDDVDPAGRAAGQVFQVAADGVTHEYRSPGTPDLGASSLLDLGDVFDGNVGQVLSKLAEGPNTFGFVDAGTGSGDMDSATYDPDGGARQVAFQDELGGGGTGDMEKSDYDPAGKNAQLATELELNNHTADTGDPHAAAGYQTQTDTDALYEVKDAVADHVALLDPHTQYADNVHSHSNTEVPPHDGLQGVNANQHIDWTVDQGATDLHPGNVSTNTPIAGQVTGILGSASVTETAVTQHQGAIAHDSVAAGTIQAHDTNATGDDLNTLTANSASDAQTLHTHGNLGAVDSLTAGTGIDITGTARDPIIAAVPLGAGEYQGTYDASVGTYPPGPGIVKGDYWVIDTAGTLPGGAVNVGDRLEAAQDDPAQTAGNWIVIPSVSDHTALTNRNAPDSHPASAVSYIPAGDLSSTDVQNALTELDTEKAPGVHTHTAGDVPDHDNLNNVNNLQHLDWTAPSVGVIHATNYVDNDTLPPNPYTSTPEGDGPGSPGASDDYARGDHQHPQQAPAAHTHDTLANVQTSRFVGRVTAATGTSENLTVTQAKSLLAYTAGQVVNAPNGNITSTDVQAAIDELDTEKAPTVHSHGNTQVPEHDQLVGFVAEEHIRWDQTGPEVVHTDRYTDTTANAVTFGLATPPAPGTGDIWVVV